MINQPTPEISTSRWLSIAPIWSASPTPFQEDLTIDTESVANLVQHHRELGVGGIMLGGTCGEGPWMPREDLEVLVRAAREAAGPDYPLAVQVTQNSPRQMLGIIDQMADAGADLALIAGSYFLMNPTPERVYDHFRKTAEASSLPVIYYDRGAHDRYSLSLEYLEDLLSIPNIVMVKDSSRDSNRREAILNVKRIRPDLVYFTGDEMAVFEAMESGADGALLGGGIFNARFAQKVMDLQAAGKRDEAVALEKDMIELMRRIYGGEKIECWLTGLKYFLCQLGIFQSTASYLEFPLADRFRNDIDSIIARPEQYDIETMLMTSLTCRK